MNILGVGKSRREAILSTRMARLMLTSSCLFAAASWCVVVLTVFPTAARAASTSKMGPPITRLMVSNSGLTAHSAASTFCEKLPAAKISAIVKAKFKFIEARVFSFTLECIYFATVPTSSKGGEIIISTHPRIPVGQVASLSAAEARVTAESPKNVKLVFTALPKIGPTAFSWSYKTPINGGQALGIADNKGTTGFGVLIGGPTGRFGVPSSHLSVAEKLLALGMSA